MKASGPAVAEDGYALEVTLGPAPCSECHSPLWYVGGKWQERHYRETGTRGHVLVDSKGGPLRLPLTTLVRTYQDHQCPMRNGHNPVVDVLPKGLQGRGGYWRRDLLGMSRRRRSPKGRPELI